jgi:hypothetical protein
VSHFFLLRGLYRLVALSISICLAGVALGRSCEALDYRLDCLQAEHKEWLARARFTRQEAQRVRGHDVGEARYLFKKAEWYYQQAAQLARAIQKLNAEREGESAPPTCS